MGLLSGGGRGGRFGEEEVAAEVVFVLGLRVEWEVSKIL